ncbi:MAG: hypothetical protein K0B81_00440 [Candidatus Cloacimonetes bacterium]|nr:hypothetical protein [Candidatus Cloacimonadota bacterium]
MKTLIIDPLAPKFDELVRQKGLENYFLKETVDPLEIEIVIVKTFTIADQEFLEKYQHLKMVIRAGSGYDNIDLKAAKKREIIVCNTPEANVIPAFEHTTFFILSLLKHYQLGRKNIIKCKWKEDLPRNWEVKDLKALIIGVGRIGSRIAKYLQEHNAEVLGVDPYLNEEEWQQRGVKNTSYQEGLKWCNLITYHCPLTKETENYFSYETLKLLNQPVWLINTARGGIVNEAALLQGINEGKILGAGLDVFVDEPSPSLPFQDYDNVYLTPHTGAYTKNAQNTMAEEILQVWESFVFQNLILNEVIDYNHI